MIDSTAHSNDYKMLIARRTGHT